MRAAGRDAGAAKVIIDHQTRRTLPALNPEQFTTEYPPPLPPTAAAACGLFVNYSDI